MTFFFSTGKILRNGLCGVFNLLHGAYSHLRERRGVWGFRGRGLYPTCSTARAASCWGHVGEKQEKEKGVEWLLPVVCDKEGYYQVRIAWMIGSGCS